MSETLTNFLIDFKLIAYPLIVIFISKLSDKKK